LDNKNSYLTRGLQAIEDLDEKRLEEILSRASVNLSQPELLQEVLVPMIKNIGDNWKNGSMRIYHEHLASAVIKTFLSNLIATFKVEQSAPEIIIATPKGQMHELGALLVAFAAASEGWWVTYLGPNLPAEEIAAAVQQNKPKALALSLVYPPDDPDINVELTKLAKYLNKDTIIFVGGNSAESYKQPLSNIKANVLFDLNAFRNQLVKIRRDK
jgi:methanogenic corrinoid protein MtbC1